VNDEKMGIKTNKMANESEIKIIIINKRKESRVHINHQCASNGGN
jgi:hypothetical protein